MSNKTSRSLVFLTVILSLMLLCSCSLPGNIFNKEEEQEPIPETPPEIITDPNWPVTIGNVTVESEPSNVVCISADLCEYLYDMDLTENLSAVSEYFDSDIFNCSLPSAGNSISPDFEIIKQIAPDYVISTSSFSNEDIIKLQQMNITVIVFDSANSVNELKELFRQLAVFFKGADDGSLYGNEYVEKYEEFLTEITYQGEKKQIAVIRNLDNLMITGKGIASDLISLSFENAAAQYDGFEYPLDSIDNFNPDAFFVGNSLHIIDFENSDIYKKKNAVKNDMIFSSDPDVLSLGSKRSINLLKDMMSTIYDDCTLGTALEPAYPSKYKS